MKTRLDKRSAPNGREGNAMFLALVAIIILTGVTGAILATGAANKKQLDTSIDRARALYIAESGLNRGIADLNSGTEVASLSMGGQATQIDFSGGAFWGTATDNGDETVLMRATGQSGVVSRAVEVVLREGGIGIFGHAVFSGNSDGDPNYTLDLGGLGIQADDIVGDVYSGGGVEMSGDATVSGVIRSKGATFHTDGVTDPEDQAGDVATGQSQPIPDVLGMSYETTADVMVATEFTSATYESDDAGGDAWQLPATNPAHIFRLNPSDRSTEVSSTTKDDYFLEDPYETIGLDDDHDGTDPFVITISEEDAGTGSVDGNNKVYFIDGNLWVHNTETFSMQLQTENAAAVAVTFVVKGNIYLSDNLFYADAANDAIALIAVEDSAEPDSGNIYFGDPEFGTLQTLEAFMYAENNFYDNNLDEAGSATVVLNGNMTAGNQVLIDRDFGTEHSKLTVNFDDRIMTGSVTLPGLPGQSGSNHKHYSVLLWREVPATD